MKVVESQLAAMIEDILYREQHASDACARRAIEATPICRLEFRPAANDAMFRYEPDAPPLGDDLAQLLFVFFLVRVKTCAKSAEKALHFAKSLTVSKRQRAALAACFLSFFSFFPSDTHSANLSTAP
ncbi:hypothetical protein [Burkholderia vietnamiensis]|uniref:hypothetical protein n=1 Tax=Burkholderia vietnamiensis TaxID=60552 RepID=UPI00158BCE69|nr:hypothetical protein [Burkholderia vietnamiensis]